MRIAIVLALIALASAPASAQQRQPAAAAPTARKLVSAIPAGPSPDQCRTTCAQTYYFCLVESEPQDCSPRWSQCRQSCNGQGEAGRSPR